MTRTEALGVVRDTRRAKCETDITSSADGSEGRCHESLPPEAAMSRELGEDRDGA